MFNFIYHLFIPHEKNNNRAKILHNSSLLILIACLLFVSLFSQVLRRTNPSILGVSYSISDQELLNLTNKIRQEHNLPKLDLNQQLSQSAYGKARNMFEKNYWAHFSSDGISPWDFIRNSGYSYIYAGENLAKGFRGSEDVINAWMASPSHRENLLSDRYRDIGFAVVPGKLLGEDTVLVVQMFGSTTPTVLARGTSREVAPKSLEKQTQERFVPQTPLKNAVYAKPVIDIDIASKTSLLFILFILLFTLTLDLFIIERRKIVRLVGHNIDHILMIVMFILVVIFEKRGWIL